jgi:hypothetical protein
MTTPLTRPSSPAAVDLDVELGEHGELLALEVERYLTARTRATAHPLVTKTTDQLVTEALTAVDIEDGQEHEVPAPAAPAMASPLSGIWRFVPDSLLRIRRPRGPVNYRHVTITQHLELTAAILERDWAHTGTRVRRLHRRCVLGAQVALYAMGYGDAMTANAAGDYITAVLRQRSQHLPFEDWNELPGRTHDQVLDVVRTAATLATEAGR